MQITLTPHQSRVVGVLMEKEVTTPEQYPLSLNALTLGCNQKSSRDPVLSLTEIDVQNILDELNRKNLLFEEHTGRTPKYKHRFCNTEFGNLNFNKQQFAVICVLLLRGPQTPGELRTRTNRLAEFKNVEEVESTLESLAQYNGDQLVKRLAKEPGKREARYAHMFSDEHEAYQADENSASMDTPVKSSLDQMSIADAVKRIDALELMVVDLQDRINKLEK